ncbi:hypothetical protein MVEN_01107800 [Mycena venus]|uniref:Uncharacterized protein n=1 Tax=Mycena venus TaxID=2733690 RepID=A0A8H6Y996_9AGAR|nr:hypothetical protein MVEN_01107800 [Mycena venus]
MSAIQHAQVFEFAAEEVKDSVTIMICKRTFVPLEDRENYLEIVLLNTKTHNNLLISCALAYAWDNPFYHPIVCGTFAAVGTNGERHHNHHTYVIFNWREQSHFIVKCDLLSLMELTEQHVVLKTSLNKEDQIHVISNGELHAY